MESVPDFSEVREKLEGEKIAGKCVSTRNTGQGRMYEKHRQRLF